MVINVLSIKFWDITRKNYKQLEVESWTDTQLIFQNSKR